MSKITPRRLIGYLSRQGDYLSRRVKHHFAPDKDEKFIFASHHKCATQYVISILRDVCRFKRLTCVKCDWRDKIDGKILRLNKFLMIQDYSGEIIDFSTVKGKGFHVIRDPRDILISLYYSHKDSHVVSDSSAAEILRDRRELNATNYEDGLNYLMENSTYWNRTIHEMWEWDYDDQRFYETSFEKITADPVAEFTNIFDFLNLNIPARELAEILDKNSFKRLKKQWNDTHGDGGSNHYRKGRPGEFKEEMPPSVKDKFKGKYSGLLLKLGYAMDSDW